MTNARFWAGTSVMRYKSDLRPGAERLAQYYDQFGRLLLADFCLRQPAEIDPNLTVATDRNRPNKLL
jgi:hypothetical protein